MYLLHQYYHDSNFEALCTELSHFVEAPSVRDVEIWFDVIYVHNEQWLQNLTKYHTERPTQASRLLLLMAIWRKLADRRGGGGRLISQGKALWIHDTILATHGLLSPLQHDPNWAAAGLLMEALYQSIQGTLMPLDWVNHVHSKVSPAWSILIDWALLYSQMYCEPDEDILLSLLSTFETQHQSILMPLMYRWLLLEGSDNRGHDYYAKSTTEHDGDPLTYLGIAVVLFKEDHAETAHMMLQKGKVCLDTTPLYKQWFHMLLLTLLTYDIDSPGLQTVINYGISFDLPQAFHQRALFEKDEALKMKELLANVKRQYWESGIELAKLLSVSADSNKRKLAYDIVTFAAKSHYAPALYWLGSDASKSLESLCFIQDATEEGYGPACFEVGQRIINNECHFDGNGQLQYGGANDIDFENGIALLENAQAAGVHEAAVLLLPLVEASAPPERYFELCTSACLLDKLNASYAVKYAVKVGRPDMVIKWSTTLLDVVEGKEKAAVLYNRAKALLECGHQDVAEDTMSEAAVLGDDRAMGYMASKNGIYNAIYNAMPEVPDKKSWWRKTLF